MVSMCFQFSLLLDSSATSNNNGYNPYWFHNSGQYVENIAYFPWYLYKYTYINQPASIRLEMSCFIIYCYLNIANNECRYVNYSKE